MDLVSSDATSRAVLAMALKRSAKDSRALARKTVNRRKMLRTTKFAAAFVLCSAAFGGAATVGVVRLMGLTGSQSPVAASHVGNGTFVDTARATRSIRREISHPEDEQMPSLKFDAQLRNNPFPTESEK